MKPINPKEVQLMVRRVQLEEKQKFGKVLQGIHEEAVRAAAYTEALQRGIFVGACAFLGYSTEEETREHEAEITATVRGWMESGARNVKKSDPPGENDPKPPGDPNPTLKSV